MNAILAGDNVLEKPTTWDITSTTGWGPDWDGPNNGRAILPELFAPPAIGGYDDHRVDVLIEEAESAPTLQKATTLWHDADAQVMKDAAFIPVEVELHPLFHSKRVHNAIFSPFSLSYDITQVWLPTTP
jgi:peptide/nickel transport system substrate-binding protein